MGKYSQKILFKTLFEKIDINCDQPLIGLIESITPMFNNTK